MRLEDIKEDTYLYCNTSHQHGIQRVYVLEKIKVEVGDDIWDDSVRYIYSYNGQTVDADQHPDQFSQTKSRRVPKCYECQVEINENKYRVELCKKCNWLICPRDGACGCNYRGL